MQAHAYVVFALRAFPKRMSLTLRTILWGIHPSFSAVRLSRFEHNFIRLLHLLAHHPDFHVDQESLPDNAK